MRARSRASRPPQIPYASGWFSECWRQIDRTGHCSQMALARCSMAARSRPLRSSGKNMSAGYWRHNPPSRQANPRLGGASNGEELGFGRTVPQHVPRSDHIADYLLTSAAARTRRASVMSAAWCALFTAPSIQLRHSESSISVPANTIRSSGVFIAMTVS